MPSDHVFVYSPDAIIQIKNFKATKDDIKTVNVIAKNNKIPKNQDFFVTVDLPLVEPLNLVPTAEAKHVKSALLLQAAVFDAASLAAVVTATPMTVGIPLNNPQRKKGRPQRELKHQTFRFAALNFSQTTVALVFHTLHRYFDDRAVANGVLFDEARPIVAEFPVQTQA